MIRLLLISFFLLTTSLLKAQSFVYSYTDPCTGVLKSMNVPTNGITVTYFGQIQTFNPNDFENGVFDAWAYNVYNSFGDQNPCGSIFGVSTAVDIAQGTAINFISVINNISALSDLQSSMSGGSLNTMGVIESAKSSSNKKDKKDKKNESNSQSQNNESGNNQSNESNVESNSNQSGGSNKNNEEGSSGNSTNNNQNSEGTSSNNSTSNNGQSNGSNENNLEGGSGNQSNQSNNQESGQNGENNQSSSGSNQNNSEGQSNNQNGSGSNQNSSEQNNESNSSSNQSSNETNGSNNQESGNSQNSETGSENGGNSELGQNTQSGSSNETNTNGNGTEGVTGSGSGNENGGELPNGSENNQNTEDKKTNFLGGTVNSTQRSTEANKPQIVLSSDFAGFNFKNNDVTFGGKGTAGYTSLSWDGKKSYGVLLDYTSLIKGPNVTGFYANIAKRRIDLFSLTGTISFAGRGSQYASLAVGQMWSFPKVKNLKAIYLATASFGNVYGERFLGTAFIGGGMYDWKVSKRIDIKMMNLFIYAPYVSYYNDILLKSPYVIMPILGTNIGITKKFKFNVNFGGAYAIKQNVMNFTLMFGTRFAI